MTDLRKRPPAGTLGTRAWRVLARRASLPAKDVAAELGVGVRQAFAALDALVERGRAHRHKVGRWNLYAAVGSHPPADRRGRAPGSRANLEPKSAEAIWLAHMRWRHGPNWHPTPRPATELERCWK